MWPSWEPERRRIQAVLLHHSQTIQQLPGIANPQALDTLALQLTASLRREAYYQAVQQKPISGRRANPNNSSFDAERAVAYHLQQGNLDEAAWLIFLMTLFGRPADTGWMRLRDVYGMLGKGIWDWQSVSSNPSAFSAWLAANWKSIRGKFGNHRKYETLKPGSTRSTARVIESYVRWIGSGGHAKFFADWVRQSGNNPHSIFDALYQGMSVKSFGRLGKFDYLSLIGRYGIAPIDAGSAYLEGATGPFLGVHLLFDGTPNGSSSVATLQQRLENLDADLKVSMKVMEDALCNWQKSPTSFIHFRG